MFGSNQIVKIISFASCKYKLKHEKKFCREKPHDTEWLELRDQKVPLLLNYSQCKLNLQEFYPVIEHCSEVLEFQPGTFRAFPKTRATK